MAALAVLSGLSLLALLNSATRNLDRYLITVLEEQLRRPVRLSSLDVLRPGRVRATGLEVAAGRSFDDGVMLRAPEIVAQYRFWDLVRGRIDPVGSVSEVILRRPYVLIVRDRDNRFNLQDLFPKKAKPPKPSPFRGTVRIEGGTARFEDFAARDLPAPQVNNLYAVDAVLDAGAPPLMAFSARARGDGRRAGGVRAAGNFQPELGAFTFRVSADSNDAPYWTRYFVASDDATVTAGRGAVTVDVWKPRQREPVSATIRVALRDAAARSRFTQAPLTSVHGALTLRTGRPFETAMDLQGMMAGAPVRVYGSVFTGRDQRLALRASAANVTQASLARILPSMPDVPWLTPLAPASVEAHIFGPLDNVAATADVLLPRAKLYTSIVTNVAARVRYQEGAVLVPSLRGEAAGGVVTAEGGVDLRRNTLRFTANLPGLELSRLGLNQLPLRGAITSRVEVSGPTSAPRARVLVSVDRGAFEQVPFDRLTARITVGEGMVWVEEAVAALPGGALTAQGRIRLGGEMDLRASASGVRLGRLLPALGYPGIDGAAFFQGNIRGTTDRPTISGEAQVYNADLRGQRLDYAVGAFNVNPDRLRLDNVRLARFPAQATLSGTATFQKNGQIGLDMLARLQGGRLEPFLRDAGVDLMVEGDIITEQPVRITGTLADPDVQGRLLLSDATVQGYPVRTAGATFRYHDNQLALSDVVAESELGSVADTTRVSLPSLIIGERELVAPEPFTITNFRLDALPRLGAPYVAISGRVNATGHISGARDDPRITADVRAENLVVNAQSFPTATASLEYADDHVTLADLSIRRPAGEALAVPRAVWDTRTHTLDARVRTAALPVQLLKDLLVQSDWYNYRADPSVRNAVRDLDRMDVQVRNATLSLAETVDNGEDSGALTVTYGPAGVSLAGAVAVRDLRMQDQNLDVLSVQGRVQDLHQEGERLMAALHIPTNGLRAESGDMIVTGNLTGAVGEDITGQVEALNIPVSIARLFLRRGPGGALPGGFDPATLQGNLTVIVDAEGRWDAPEVVASISGQDLRAPGSDLPLSIRTSAIRIVNEPEGSRIEIQRNISILARDHSVKLTGFAPFDWKTKRIPADKPLNLVAHVDEQSLDMLSLLLGGSETGPIESATGTLVADLSLSGTLNDPRWAGYLDVEDGAVKLRILRTTFRNIQANFRLTGASNAVEIARLEVESSDGGRLRLTEGSRVRLPRSIGSQGGFAPDLGVDLQRFRIVEAPNALGLGERFQATMATPENEPLRIEQAGANPVVRGSVLLTDVDVTPPNQTPAAKGAVSAPPLVPAFDLSLVVGKNVWVRNPLFRVLLNDRGDVAERRLHFSGTLLQPRITGNLTSREGTFNYPTARFRLTNARVRVHYPPVEGVGPDTALDGGAGFTIEADAQTRLIATVNGQRQPVTVYMHIEGPNMALTPGLNNDGAFGSLAPYRLTLRSSPSLPERQLVSLISREEALQRLAEGGNPEEVLRQETLNILQASVLPEALSGFESRLGEAFGLEALTLDYTMVNNTLSVTAVKRLSDRIVLSYSRPIGATVDENAYTISLNYQLRPRLQLTLQQQRGQYVVGQHRANLPGSASSITESLLLLEGTYPF